MSGTGRGRGRPSTPPSVVSDRKERWRAALRFSGLTVQQAADHIGCSTGLVRSYSSKRGVVPSERAIQMIESYCAEKAAYWLGKA